MTELSPHLEPWRKLPQWLLWQKVFDPEKGTYSKKPRMCKKTRESGHTEFYPASPKKPEHWTTFTPARIAFEQADPDAAHGIGFVFRSKQELDQRWFAFDLDMAKVDPAKHTPEQLEAIKLLYRGLVRKTYCERSPSGKSTMIDGETFYNLHAYGFIMKPALMAVRLNGLLGGLVDTAYESSYMTVTGDVIAELPLADLTVPLEWVIERHKATGGKMPDDQPQTVSTLFMTTLADERDIELVKELLRNEASWPIVKQLFVRGKKAPANHSAADMSLAVTIARHTFNYRTFEWFLNEAGLWRNEGPGHQKSSGYRRGTFARAIEAVCAEQHAKGKELTGDGHGGLRWKTTFKMVDGVPIRTMGVGLQIDTVWVPSAERQKLLLPHRPLTDYAYSHGQLDDIEKARANRA